jgi:hypothetical protein
LRTQDNPEQIPRLSRQTAELLWKSTGRNLENLHSFALAERAFPEIIFCLDWAPMQVVIVRQFRPRCLGATGDHFQPHYRMPFALVSGRKDRLFSIDLAASHCLLILWLSAAPLAD